MRYSQGTVASDRNIRRLKRAIWVKYGLESVHLAGQNVNEFLRNRRIWQWEVQTFGLLGVDGALCFAWFYRENGVRQIGIVRESNQVRTPLRAVRIHIRRTRRRHPFSKWQRAA